MSDLIATMIDAVDKHFLQSEMRRMDTRDRSTPTVFNVCMHGWGNIGDLALNLTEIRLLETTFPAFEVFGLSRSELAANWVEFGRTVEPHDILVVHGGGNMGDIWPHEERARLAVVEKFPNNTIISMPQSIHFQSKASELESMRIYERHENLILAVRDERSLSIARSYLPEHRVGMTPDSATRYELPFRFQNTRIDVHVIARNDAERAPSTKIGLLAEMLATAPLSVTHSDTMVDGLRFSNRQMWAKTLYKKVDELACAGVVVTDRLHGALFALIARRPVVVFDNSYGKIRSALGFLLPTMGAHITFADELPLADVIEMLAPLSQQPDAEITPSMALAPEHKRFDDWIRDRS